MEKTLVVPCKPPAPYLGGKKHLAGLIARLIAATDHDTYAEPFIGMGGIFFRRASKPEAEFINDRSRDVANLFRILQRHYQAFLDTLKWQLTSRSEFERLIRTDAETLTDLERAARFLYLQRTRYGGHVVSRTFNATTGSASRFDLTKLVPMLEAVHERLSSVTIECLDYKDFISRYDGPHTLFYLDPPYYGSEDDYGRDLFDRSEFALMCDLLDRIAGKFLLSLNDCPEVREIFSGFFLREVQTTYSVSGKSQPEVKELLISNFEGVLAHEQRAMF